MSSRPRLSEPLSRRRLRPGRCTTFRHPGHRGDLARRTTGSQRVLGANWPCAQRCEGPQSDDWDSLGGERLVPDRCRRS